MTQQASPKTAAAPDLFAAVYPRSVKGRFRRLKWTVVAVLLAVYYILPWLRWDRGAGAPGQAVLIDIPGARVYLFGLEIWPQEVYYLTGLLIIAAIGLFLATTLFGRLWCGYGCPQTVWTDLFMAVERRIEGDRNARIKLDKAPWTAGKLLRKTAKHAAWILISLLTGGAFVLYFVDAPSTLLPLLTGRGGAAAAWSVAILTSTVYLLAGWGREQVCTYMCPWPRIQAPMLDEHSIIVSYDAARGEPRGHHKGNRAAAAPSSPPRGDCVDCSLCVQVCPTGIDIRNGLQMGCIGCGLCIDACNGVMAKSSLPPNLIGWSSLAERSGAVTAQGRLGRQLRRPRIALYIASILVTAAVMTLGLAHRHMLDLDVLHERSPLFVRLPQGAVRNGFTLNILNKSRQTSRLELTVSGLEGAAISVVGGEAEGAAVPLTARPDTVETYQLQIRSPAAALRGTSMPITFSLRDTATGATATHDSMFFAGD